jgi:hypothetical protein
MVTYKQIIIMPVGALLCTLKVNKLPMAIPGKPTRGFHQQVPQQPGLVYYLKSSIFNHYLEVDSAYSWSLKFKKQEELENIQNGVMQALWEHLNKVM